MVRIDANARAAHLLPIYRVPDDFSHHDALDSFNSFFVNLLTTMHMRNQKAGFSDGGCDRNIYMVYHMILQHGKYKNRAEMTGSSQLFTCISASYPL